MLQLSPNAVAHVSDDPVTRIAHWQRNPAQHPGNQWPWRRQLLQQGHDSLRPDERALPLIGFVNQKNRALSFCGIQAVFGQERNACRGVDGHKAKPVLSVAPEQPLNQAVAQPAAAIEDDDQPAI
jgi:hypothetical protein